MANKLMRSSILIRDKLEFTTLPNCRLNESTDIIPNQIDQNGLGKRIWSPSFV